MLIIYRKDTQEVVHYVDFDGVNIDPSLFGLYHACLKYNIPELTFEDYGDYYVNENTRDEEGVYLRDKIISYSKIKVILTDDVPSGLDFIDLGVSDPVVIPETIDQSSKINELEATIQAQQKLIDEILKKLG